ncbi:hypothetical protein NQ317_009132 [Molorchus minor]|uniref:Uncharacterized protein n=1 Tax=Molorchus minor TaxID=1323400 RepID=A0ABQ9IZS9_9CUCU|nr:hypothetical protein NQ317_009132 [Molorchus minor]
MEKFVIVKDTVKKVKRFNLAGRTLEFKIKPLPENEEPVGWIRDAINQVITKRHPRPKALEIEWPSLSAPRISLKGDGWVRFRPVEEVTHDDVWGIISSIYQSKFWAWASLQQFQRGMWNASRNSITINNKDNMCLPRALVVAIAYTSKDTEKNKVRRDIGKLQTQRAVQLCDQAGVVIPEEGCGIPELQHFQQHLKQYKIVVYQFGNKGRDIIFKGSTTGPTLNLIYHKGHYNVITSLTAAFCVKVRVQHVNNRLHAPKKLKSLVLTVNVALEDKCVMTIIKTHDRWGTVRFVKKIRRCEQCHKTVQSSRQHTCEEIYCKICKSHVPSNHLCYIQPDTSAPQLDNLLFVFYDLETRQEKILEDGSLLHEPNLSHNGQAFDHQFVLNYILTNTDLTPELIMRGTKIISMVVENVKFLDSLQLFPHGSFEASKGFRIGR